MPYIIEIEHEWNKSKKGYMAHSAEIGDHFASQKEEAMFHDTLENVGETLEFLDENFYISLEDGRYRVTSILEVELVEKRKIDIQDF